MLVLAILALGFVTVAVDSSGAETGAPGDQGTGGYPWANAPIGTLDDIEMDVRICSSYVAWKLRQNGTPAERAMWSGIPREARLHFETVNGTPAAGSAMSYDTGSPTGHVVYVESVDFAAGTMVVSDYNGSGGAYRYGIHTMPIPDAARMARINLSFIHYELPPVAGGKFMTARRMYGRRSMLSNRTLFEEERFIMSPNERYILMLDPTGTLALYDRQNDFQTKWQMKFPRKEELEMAIVDNRPKVKLILEEANSWKRMKSWFIGAARKIHLTNTGELAGMRGGKEVWRAATLKQVPKVARAALREARSGS